MKKIWTHIWISIATLGIMLVTSGLILLLHFAKAGLWVWNSLPGRRATKQLV